MSDSNDDQDVCEFFAPKKRITMKIAKANGKYLKIRNNENKNKIWPKATLFKEQWSLIEANFKRNSSCLTEGYVDKLKKFLDKYVKQESVVLRNGQRIGSNFGMIPTALITLNSLATQMQIAKVVSRLFSSDSIFVFLDNSTLQDMSNVLPKFCQALFGDHHSTIDDEDIEDWDILFETLLIRNEDRGSPRPRESIVVVVYEFENVNKHNLCKLIALLKEHCEELSIVFIFMIHSEMNSSIQYFLPAEAIDYLMIEDICTHHDHKLISEFFADFLMDRFIQFRVHPVLLREIYDHAIGYELSVSNLMFYFKSIVFEYFYSNPFSIICHHGDKKETVSRLLENPDTLNLFRNSVSFKKDKLYEEDDEGYAEYLSLRYSKLMHQHCRFVVNLYMILDMMKMVSIETQPFVYYYCDIANAKPSYDYNSLFSPFNKVTQEVLDKALKKMLTKYKEELEQKWPLLLQLECFSTQLQEIILDERKEREHNSDAAKKLGLSCDIEIVKDRLRNLSSRSEMRETLRPRNKTSSKYDLLKQDVMRCLEDIVEKNHLRNHENLINLVFFKDGNFLSDHHFASLRDRLRSTLERPRNENERSSGDDVDQECDEQSALVPISTDHHKISFLNIYPTSYILFKLYQNSSPVINLFDWFEMFCQERRMNGKNSSKTTNLQDANNRAHSIVSFMSVVTDFEYIGLLQASVHKTDYVNKLAWL